MSRLRVELTWSPCLPKQWEAFKWEPPVGTKQVVEGMLGGWGAGKTDGAARLFVKRSVGHGWRPDYGEKNPKSYVCAPTWRVMRQATLPALEAVFPRQLIRKKRKSPVYEWSSSTTTRSCSSPPSPRWRASARAWAGATRSSTPTTGATRGASRTSPCIRDPKAGLLRPRSMILSGLPESGPVRDTFDRPDDPAGRLG